MPVLDVLSGNQLQAIRGSRGRPVLGDLLLQARADLPARMAFQQRERELALQADALTRQEQAAREAVTAQQRSQRQQGIATAISGVGQGAMLVETVAPGTLKGLATSAGILSPAAAAAPSAAATAGTTAEFGLAAAPAAGPAASGGAAAAGGTGVLGAVAGGAGGAVVGTAAGRLHQAYAPSWLEQAETFPFGFFLSKGATQKLAGAKFGGVVGAATGFLTGGPVGAVIGGIGGALGGAGICIILTACAESAEEIALAKRYREHYMNTAAKRGYYMVAEPIAARMQHDEIYCQHIRHALVLPLLRYGAYTLGETAQRPSLKDEEMAEAFLGLCEGLGRSVRQYVRQTGEIV